MDYLEIITIIGTVGAACTTLYGGYRMVRGKPARIVNSFLKVFSLIDEIHEQLSPYNGRSLRQSIERIERSLDIEKGARHSLSNLTGIAMWETNSRGECVWVNDEWVKLTGLPADRAMGHGWVNAIHNDDRDMVRDGFDKAIVEKRQFTQRLRYVNVNSDVSTSSSEIWVYVSAVPVFNADGELIAHHGITRVIE